MATCLVRHFYDGPPLLGFADQHDAARQTRFRPYSCTAPPLVTRLAKRAFMLPRSPPPRRRYYSRRISQLAIESSILVIVDLVVAPSPQLDARRQLVGARDARVVLREDFTEIRDGARRVLTRRRVEMALAYRVPMRVVVRFRRFPIRSDRRLESDNAPSAVEILRSVWTRCSVMETIHVVSCLMETNYSCLRTLGMGWQRRGEHNGVGWSDRRHCTMSCE